MTTDTQTAADPKRRAALGKGIEALLGPRPPLTPPKTEASGGPLEIRLELIDRNPRQTRTSFDEAKLAELAASIRATGVVQPIVVRPLSAGRYELIMGERRWRASQIAGLASIPAIVRQVADEQSLEMNIVENLQRADLNAIEQARAFERLGRDFKMTQEQIATRTGKDRASVSNFLRLLKLPESVRDMIEAGDLSFGHGRALLALDSPEKIAAVALRIKVGAMSVRQTETLVQGMLNPERKQVLKTVAASQDPNVHEAEEKLQRRLGLKVRIEDKKGRGRVIIEYAGIEDFDAILEALGDG